MNLESLTNEWYPLFKRLEGTEYLEKLNNELESERDYTEVLPEKNNMFLWLRDVSPKDVKVVILTPEIISPGYNWDGSYKYHTTLFEDVITNNLEEELIRTNLISFKGIFQGLKSLASKDILVLPTSWTSTYKPYAHIKLWFPLFKLFIKFVNSRDKLVIVVQEDLQQFRPLLTNKDHIIINSPNFKSKDIIGSNLFKVINQQLKNINLKEINY